MNLKHQMIVDKTYLSMKVKMDQKECLLQTLHLTIGMKERNSMTFKKEHPNPNFLPKKQRT